MYQNQGFPPSLCERRGLKPPSSRSVSGVGAGTTWPSQEIILDADHTGACAVGFLQEKPLTLWDRRRAQPGSRSCLPSQLPGEATQDDKDRGHIPCFQALASQYPWTLTR